MTANLREVVKSVTEFLKSEDRKEDWFRALIAVTEVGDIVKYITHDPNLNPGARPHGTKKDEALAYGQAFVQLIAAMILRGVDIDEAIKLGLKNWEENDWRKRNGGINLKAGRIGGIGVIAGPASGTIYVVSDEHPAHAMPDHSIVVSPFAKPDLVEFYKRMTALITDHGGATCHAANIAREKNLVCIVGTGKATTLLQHGKGAEITVTSSDGDAELVFEYRS